MVGNHDALVLGVLVTWVVEYEVHTGRVHT